MKSIKTITIIALIAIIALGWIFFLIDKGSDLAADNSAVKIADQYVEEGLYQRAILKYNEALSYNYKKSTVEKMLNAYKLRYSENTNITEDYIAALNVAVNNFPKEAAFTSELVELYVKQGDYESAYDKLVFSFNNGLKDEKLYQKKQELRYSYSLDASAYNEFLPFSEGAYTAFTGDVWVAVDSSGETVSGKYPYMSSSNGGIRVYENDKDTRLINADGLVMGIFKTKLQNAGLFSENLIPVCIDNKYAYYDAFAKKVFGDFEYAGAFQNGKAAVKKDGKWVLIDTSGKEVSEKFADIIVDKNGKYINGDAMIAAKESGKYQMFDADGKKLNDFSASEMDICTSNGWIAFEKDGKWGFVNTSGKIVIEPTYEKAKSFSNALAAVCVDGKWGYIDPSNEIVIKCQFVNADYFNEAGSSMICMAQPEESNDSEKEPTTKEVWKLLKLNLGLKGE